MKTRKILACIIILGITVCAFAQYTGSDIERKRAENLYPEPGPGELLIVDQLKQTNTQLEEQTRLLLEQNRILRATLDELKKEQQEKK